MSREQKESVLACFDQNAQCHIDLAEASKPSPIAWQNLGLALLAGAVLGIVVQQELKH